MQTVSAQNYTRKSLAPKFAPLLSNSFALPTKTICAAKEMARARICRALAKSIATVRVPSFVALTTVPGLLRGSTVARKNARQKGVAINIIVALARQMRESVIGIRTA